MVSPTPSQTIGPFFSPGTAWLSRSLPADEQAVVSIGGQIFDGNGEPVPDAMVERWQADGNGRFEPRHCFARCFTDGDGRFGFATVKPGRVDAEQAPHIDLSVFARGLLQRVVTRIYFPDEVEANRSDPVLSGIDDPDRRSSLVARTDGDGLRFDIRLRGPAETVFFAW